MEDTVFRSHEGFWGKYADWYPFPEMHQNLIALCMGLETKEPLLWFDEKRLVVTYQINENMKDVSDLCDRDYVRWRFDPRHAFHGNETKDKIEKNFRSLRDVIGHMNSKGYMYSLLRIDHLHLFNHFFTPKE